MAGIRFVLITHQYHWSRICRMSFAFRLLAIHGIFKGAVSLLQAQPAVRRAGRERGGYPPQGWNDHATHVFRPLESIAEEPCGARICGDLWPGQVGPGNEVPPVRPIARRPTIQNPVVSKILARVLGKPKTAGGRMRTCRGDVTAPH